MNHLFDVIRDLPSPFNMVALICLFFAIAGVVTGVVTQIRKYACHRQELDFKREMLDRGMSADEIAQVVEAAPPGGWLSTSAKQQSEG